VRTKTFQDFYQNVSIHCIWVHEIKEAAPLADWRDFICDFSSRISVELLREVFKECCGIKGDIDAW
jgi:hypothetical protein